jgi:hypothetical protein
MNVRWRNSSNVETRKGRTRNMMVLSEQSLESVIVFKEASSNLIVKGSLKILKQFAHVKRSTELIL